MLIFSSHITYLLVPAYRMVVSSVDCPSGFGEAGGTRLAKLILEGARRRENWQAEGWNEVPGMGYSNGSSTHGPPLCGTLVT